MTILGQDFYTAHNTVKDVAQSVAIGQEVDRKKNLMGSLNDLYQQKPNASLEDLRAQYAVYGTPEDLDRIDGKIQARNGLVAGQKLQMALPQMEMLYKTNDQIGIQSLAASLNNDPDLAKAGFGKINFTPAGETEIPVLTNREFTDPNGNKIKALAGDIIKYNVNNKVYSVDSTKRVQHQEHLQNLQQKAQLKTAGDLTPDAANFLELYQRKIASDKLQSAQNWRNTISSSPQYKQMLSQMTPQAKQTFIDYMQKLEKPNAIQSLQSSQPTATGE